MGIQPKHVQLEREKTIRERLDADDGVRRAVEEVRDRTSGFGLVQRRRLLTNALRLTPGMAPEIADSVERARRILDIDEPVEVYVRPEPMFNAFCFRDPTGLLVIGLSSRVVEEFSATELDFVIGHEFGHAYFEHFAIPMPHTAVVEDLAGPLVSRPMALNLYLWCRLAELSSDRIGLLCSRDSEAAISSFFKLASGTSSERLRPDLEAFASQVDSLAAAPEARKDEKQPDQALGSFSTHPYSPARVRALLAFSRSEPYLNLTGDTHTDALSREELKRAVERDISLMEPSYLEEKSEESRLMRDLLYQAGMLVAAADGQILEQETKALQSLLGADRVDDDHPEFPHEDIATIRQRIDDTLERVVAEVPQLERARLVQHLTIISAADGETDDHEIAVMTRIARRLNVDPRIIDQTLAAASRPMGDMGSYGA
jgi:Zn-dependent protease with chaperone function/uncharacterized tellurite resistance protein B-like protein